MSEEGRQPLKAKSGKGTISPGGRRRNAALMTQFTLLISTACEIINCFKHHCSSSRKLMHYEKDSGSWDSEVLHRHSNTG